MKLIKTLVRAAINPIDNIEHRAIYLPEGTNEGDSIIIKDVDKSQAFRVIKIFDDENIIISGDLLNERELL